MNEEIIEPLTFVSDEPATLAHARAALTGLRASVPIAAAIEASVMLRVVYEQHASNDPNSKAARDLHEVIDQLDDGIKRCLDQAADREDFARMGGDLNPDRARAAFPRRKDIS